MYKVRLVDGTTTWVNADDVRQIQDPGMTASIALYRDFKDYRETVFLAPMDSIVYVQRIRDNDYRSEWVRNTLTGASNSLRNSPNRDDELIKHLEWLCEIF